MIRRPKVQFKPKIQSRAVKTTGVPKSPTKSRTSSVSSVTSTSSANQSATSQECPSQPKIPITRTTITIIEGDDDQLPGTISGSSQPEVVGEEQVIEYETLEPVQLSDYNCLIVEPQPIIEQHVSLDSSHEASSQSILLESPIVESTVEQQTPSLERRGSRITLKPKETPAALTVSSHNVSSSEVSKKKSGLTSPRRPKICLSSTKVKLPEDRTKVTMLDLLSYNPPMSQEQKDRKRKADQEAEEAASIISSSPKKSVTESVKKAPSIKSTTSKAGSKEGSSQKSQGPRVKFVDGKVIIDEESLVLTSNIVDPVGDTVYESKEEAEHGANYASFRGRYVPGKKYRWSNEDTVEFYRALSGVGTDFTLMSKLFFKGQRTRIDLRNKFKKEEKFNQALIDKTLKQTDLSVLREILEKGKEEEITEDKSANEADVQNPDNQDLELPVQETHGTTVTPASPRNEQSEKLHVPQKNIKRGSRKKKDDQDDDVGYESVSSVSGPFTRRSTRTVKAPIRLS
jgi:transcription factor TFIIIB component B''